jgi:hypothetical protein
MTCIHKPTTFPDLFRCFASRRNEAGFYHTPLRLSNRESAVTDSCVPRLPVPAKRQRGGIAPPP